MAAAAAAGVEKENENDARIVDLVLLRWDESIRIVQYDLRLRQMRWCPSNDDGEVYAVARQRTRATDEPRRGAVQCSGAVQRVPPRGWGDRVKMLISDCFADVKSTNALLLENGWPSGKWKPHNSGFVSICLFYRQSEHLVLKKKSFLCFLCLCLALFRPPSANFIC